MSRRLGLCLVEKQPSRLSLGRQHYSKLCFDNKVTPGNERLDPSQQHWSKIQQALQFFLPGRKTASKSNQLNSVKQPRVTKGWAVQRRQRTAQCTCSEGTALRNLSQRNNGFQGARSACRKHLNTMEYYHCLTDNYSQLITEQCRKAQWPWDASPLAITTINILWGLSKACSRKTG